MFQPPHMQPLMSFSGSAKRSDTTVPLYLQGSHQLPLLAHINWRKKNQAVNSPRPYAESTPLPRGIWARPPRPPYIIYRPKRCVGTLWAMTWSEPRHVDPSHFRKMRSSPFSVSTNENGCTGSVVPNGYLAGVHRRCKQKEIRKASRKM